MSTGLLIAGGTLVTAESSRRGDLRVRGGRIVEVDEHLEPAGEEIVDATDLLVMPGGVDPHVHMELPVAGTVSSDDFESGTAAGLAGGTTSIIDFVHPEREQDFLEALAARREEAAKAVADYGLHMAVTWWGDGAARGMADCVAAGVPSFKLYMAYKATVGLEDVDLVEVMRTAAELDGLLLVHAEQGRRDRAAPRSIHRRGQGQSPATMPSHDRRQLEGAGDRTARRSSPARPGRGSTSCMSPAASPSRR